MTTTQSASQSLDTILGAAYQAIVMGRKDLTTAESQFTAAMADPDFATEAHTRLTLLSSVEPDRCFISKTSADFLRRMLAT